MEIQLKVVVGGSAGQVLKIPGPKFFIGRAEDCHLRPGSDLVSRHHCVLLVEGDVFAVRDFGSKNGTYVNDARVTTECELHHGDRLKVGPLEFEVSMVETQVATKRPKVTSIKEAAVRTAQSGSDSNVDVGDWLSSDAEDIGDTKEINRTDTREIQFRSTTTPAPSKRAPAEEPTVDETTMKSEAPTIAENRPKPAAPAPAKESSSVVKKPEELATDKTAVDKKLPGKLPPLPKRSTDSSHSAAADMLKKLRRRT